MPRRSFRSSRSNRASVRSSRSSRPSLSGTRMSQSTGSFFRNKLHNQMVYRARKRNYIPGSVTRNPFPDNKFYKLSYSSEGTLSVGTSGTFGTEQQWRLNSLWDCDYTSSGHQPYGFDALAVAYDRYKVFGVYVMLEFYNVQTVNAITVGLQMLNPSEVGAVIAGITPDKVAERPSGSTFHIQNIGSGRTFKRFYIPMYKIFNMSSLQYKVDIENTTAGVGGNPGSNAMLTMAAADPNGNSSGLVRYKATLVFSAQLYQSKIMAQS